MEQPRGTVVPPRQGVYRPLSPDRRACDKLPPDTRLDGEVSASMRAVVSRSTPYSTVTQGGIFSSVRRHSIHRGRNVVRLPIEERRRLLTEALQKVEYPVIRSTPFDVKPTDLIRAAKELQFEE